MSVKEHRDSFAMAGTAIALRRTYGALFFSCFGSCWLLLSAYAFGAWKAPEVIVIVLGGVLLVCAAVVLQKRAKRIGGEAAPNRGEHRDNKMFGLLNVIQWVLIFIIFTLFPKFGYGDMAFPAVIVIVGIHFFVMPASYRHRANSITGVVLIASAVLSSFLFEGDRLIAIATLCAGTTLWASAGYALMFAVQQLRFKLPQSGS